MRRRHKVAMRPEAKRLRRVRLASGVGLLAAAFAIVIVVRKLPKDALRPSALVRRIPIPAFLIVERVSVVGAPAAVEPLLLGALAAHAGKPWGFSEGEDAERELLERFPFLEVASAHRDWRGREVSVAVQLRTPVARASRRGKPAAWLSDSGVVFEAPEGTYPPLQLPVVELEGSLETELPALAAFVTAASRELPGGIARVLHRSREQGWEVIALDGTNLLWGRLDWTEQKLLRLQEVLGDAGKRFGPGLTADLRYFEDGKILVRPAGPVRGQFLR